MRKLKLLFTGLALVGGVLSASAEDVTSYLTNPGFEEGQTEIVKTGGGAYNKPSGWEFSEKPESSSYHYAQTTTDYKSEGSKSFKVRFNWASFTTELQQTISDIPAGFYTLKADVRVYKKGSSASIEAYIKETNNGVSVESTKKTGSSSPSFETLTINFEVKKQGSLVIALCMKNTNSNNNSENACFWDNVTLSYNYNSGEPLAALIAQATSINSRTGDLDGAITAAQGVYDVIDNTPAYQETIDDAISDLRNAIETSLGSYVDLDGTGDDVTAFIANSDFETSPIFDGIANGTSKSANATATTGSTTKPFNSINAYNIAGWELQTISSSDYARAFTMPYNNTLYVQSNGTKGDQAIAAPTNGSSVTTSNNYLLLIHSSWSNTLVNTIEQTIPLPEGSYRLTFDSYVTTTISNAESRCGISYGTTPTAVYRWPEAKDTWTANTIDFVLEEQTDVTFSLGYKKTADVGTGSTPMLFVDNLKLMYYNPLGIAQAQWQDVHDALAALDVSVLPAAAAAAITTELAKEVPTTSADDVNDAMEDLQALIDSYDDIKAAYDKAKDLISLATAEMNNSIGIKTDIGAAIETATTNIETRTSDVDLGTDFSTLESARQTYVLSGAQPTADQVFDFTFKISDAAVTGTGDWSNTTTNSGNQYTDAPDDQYFDCGYKSTFQSSQTITDLPAGFYQMKAVTRKGGSNITSANIYANNSANSSYNQSTNNTTGSLGNNWGWTEVNFEKPTSAADISIGFYASTGDNSYAGADDFHLYYKGNKFKLKERYEVASGYDGKNTSDGPFKFSSSAQTDLASAISTAEGIYDNVEKTSDEVHSAIDDINTAINDYINSELNAPAEGAVFNVMITTNDNYGFKEKPLTFNSDNVGGANFIKANGVAPYRAQQITFTKVSGNQYTLSMVNADGDRVYIRTNASDKGGNGNSNQIRLTTNEEYALAVQIIPSSSTDGVYTLKNTEANALLGCQDADSNPSGGLFTVGSHNNFTITEATKPSVPVTIADDVKFATRIFPFKPTLPDGVKAYSCEAKNASNYLTLVEVAEPAANVPYILYAENGSSGILTGYGTATQDSYDAGWLNGVYTDTEAPVGSYVLQKHGSEVAFYQVASGEESKPTVGAYRCYLSGVDDARALYFDFDETTAVETIQALTTGKNTIYNVTGKVVPSLQKGMNIIKTSDGKIRKVIIK